MRVWVRAFVASPTCGHPGERACCFTEGSACVSSAIEVPGCSGDCACGGGFASSGMCTVIAPIAEPATGWKEPKESLASPLRGYADLHLHLFANLAHGGGVLAGSAFDPKGGVNAALREDYGTDLDLTSKDGGDRFLLGAESNLGAPIFNGWPIWNTTTHQQAYHAWLERAWRGGLRLTVMLAVTNEALCKNQATARHRLHQRHGVDRRAARGGDASRSVPR